MIIKTYDLIGLDKCYACDIKFKALKEAHLNALSKLDSLGITLYSDGGDDFVYLYKDKLSFGYDITIDGETFDVSIEYKVLNKYIHKDFYTDSMYYEVGSRQGYDYYSCMDLDIEPQALSFISIDIDDAELAAVIKDIAAYEAILVLHNIIVSDFERGV